MNKLTKLAAWFLAGTMLAFTGCSDYDDDIDAVNKRVDELTTGKIATLEEQATALKASLSSLEAAYKAADTELKNQLAKQVEDLTKADDALQKAIDKVKTDLTAKHDQDVQTLRSEISKAVGDLTQALNTAKSELDGKITGVDSKVSSLDAKVENYNTTLTKAVEKVAADLAAVSGKLTVLEGTVDALSSKHDADVAALRTEIAEKVAAVKTEVLAKLAEDKAELQGQITAAVERIAALEESVKTINGQIKTIEGQISQMQSAIAGKVDKTDFDAYTKKTDAAVKANAEALGVLNALCAGFPENTTIKGYIDAAIADVTGAVSAVADRCTTLEENYKTLSENFGAFKADIEPRVEANETAISVLNAWKQEMTAEGGTIDRLESRIKALEDNQLTLDDVKAQFSAEVAEFKAGVDAVIAQALAADGAISAAIAAKANELTQAFDNKFSGLAARVATLELRVDEMMSRIQSLVYVPEYNDHKATVDALYYTPAEGDPVLLANGQVVMTFRVTPVEMVNDLVNYWNAAEENRGVLTLELEKVKTRAVENAAITIESIAVDKEKGNGRFIVTATPEFPADFYAGKGCYSVALRLNKAYAAAEDEAEELSHDVNADIVSDYVNLVPGKTAISELVLIRSLAEDRKVTLKDGDTYKGEAGVDGEYGEYEIAYDNTEKVVALLDGFVPNVKIGDDYLTIPALEAAGYKFAVEVACQSKAYLKSGDAAADFAAAGFAAPTDVDAKACDETVQLDPETVHKTNIGNTLVTEHVYTLTSTLDDEFGALTATFKSSVLITPTKATVRFADQKFYWTYSEFLPLYKAGEEYEGSEQSRAMAVVPADAKLPVGMKPEDVVTYWGANSCEYNAYELTIVDGEKKLGAKVEGFKAYPVAYDAEKNAYTMAVEGYKFGKTYRVSSSQEFSSATLCFEFDIEFIGLPEQIDVALKEAPEFAYEVKKDAFTGKVENIFDEIYDRIEAHGPHFADKAEFYKSFAEAYADNSYPQANTWYTAKSVYADRQITMKDFWSFDVANPAKSSTVRVLFAAGDDAYAINAQINLLRSDVTAADFDRNNTASYTFESKIVPNYLLPIFVKAEATVKLPDYGVVRVLAWVEKEKDQYYSQVKGLWDPNMLSTALSAFSVKDIELESAFRFVKKDENGQWAYVSAEEIEAQKLAFSFAIPDEPAHPGIAIGSGTLENGDASDYLLSYYGGNPYVKVDGAVSIDGIEVKGAFANGCEFDLKTAADYTNYIVKKFDPIKEFKSEYSWEIETASAEKVYTHNFISLVSLRDVRTVVDEAGTELIDPEGTVADPWITGDDMNGFESGKTPKEVFQLGDIVVDPKLQIAYVGNDGETYVGDASADFGKHVSIDTATGVLTFSNLNNLALQKNVRVTVSFSLSYPWAEGGKKNGTVTYLIKK